MKKLFITIPLIIFGCYTVDKATGEATPTQQTSKVIQVTKKVQSVASDAQAIGVPYAGILEGLAGLLLGGFGLAKRAAERKYKQHNENIILSIAHGAAKHPDAALRLLGEAGKLMPNTTKEHVSEVKKNLKLDD